MTKTCLRCDWAGDSGATTCPSCGAPLFHASSEPRDVRPAPPVMEAEDDERTLATPSPRPSTSPRAVLAVAGGIFVAIGFLLSRGGPDESSRRVAPPEPSEDPTGGHLVYAAAARDGGARLWQWDLETGRVARGPLVADPVAFVNVASPAYGWLGVTSRLGDGSLEATFLDSLTPRARAEPIGRGDIVTWTRQGRTVVLVRRGPLVDRCRRVVDVTAATVGNPVGFSNRRTILHRTICGDVASVGRTSVGYFLTVIEDGDSDIVGFGYPDAGVLLPDHGLIDISPGGDFLVTAASEFLSGGGGADGPITVAGEASRFRLFGGPPEDLLSDSGPIRIERVLAYGDAGTTALVIGRQGRDGPALWEVPLGILGDDPGLPRYVAQVRGATSAAYADDGVAFILNDARLWTFEDGRLQPLDLPDGAPTPTGPLAWIVRPPLLKR